MFTKARVYNTKYIVGIQKPSFEREQAEEFGSNSGHSTYYYLGFIRQTDNGVKAVAAKHCRR